MSDDSDRSRAFGRWGAAAGLVLVGGYLGCSFPEHTFQPDDEFYGISGSAGAGVGATGGGGTGATGGGGTGATGGGGTGATGATGGGGTGATGGGGTGATGGGGTGATGGGGTGGTGGTPTCSGGMCVPNPPIGWTGPVAYYDGPAPAPPCPTDYPTVLQTASSTLDVGTPTCPSCGCGTPTGVSCQADVVFFDGQSCGGSGCWGWGLQLCGAQPPLPPDPAITVTSICKAQNLCWDAGGTTKPQSAVFSNLIASGGTCAPTSSGTKNIPTPAFSKTVRACGGSTGGGSGCNVGSTCMPNPTSPFSPGICIFKTGDAACPGGAWATKLTVYTSFTDTRDCSACTCGSPSGTCSGASMEFYTDQTCSNATGKITISTPEIAGCTDLPADSTPIAPPSCQGNGGDSRSMKLVGGSSSGTCSASGGQVTGAATATGPVTFCCL